VVQLEVNGINFSASGRLPDVAGGGSSSKDFPPIDAQWIEVRAKKAALKVSKPNLKVFVINYFKRFFSWRSWTLISRITRAILSKRVSGVDTMT
jgi:hypothetical protein